MIISRLIRLRMRNVSNESCRGNQITDFVFNNCFSKIVSFMRWCGKNTVQRGRPRMTIRRMRIACCITKATHTHTHTHTHIILGESLARGPKLLSIKNYVIEIMTWKFIYTYRERCKTGPAHNRCWNWSPFTSKHTWMRFSKFWNTFPKVSTLKAWISWHIASLSCSIVRGVFLYTLPFNRTQRKKSAGVRSASPCL